MTWDADVVVVGSGAAGISVALTAAASGLRVLVVTKDLVGGATPLAQGGLAAALGAGDSPAAHVSDTLVAGAGLCSPDIVAALAAGAPGAIDWLSGLGARLETRDLRLEGGHSARRIVHSGDDATGAEVHRTLLAALLASGIEILDRTVALDLFLSGERVTGLLAGAIRADGRLTPGMISARAVVIAAGGLGQAFGTTSNPAGATGDGIAIAARAGAVIRDLEFVQFHPTVLWLPGASGQCPLITEALRGAGAVLRDLDGTPLMAGHDPRGDLAPRDVVAARMAEVIAAAGAVASAGHVWLDATALGRELLEGGFPTVTAACRKHGIDPVVSMIPVAPGAHYSCGGIRADLDGRTSVPGLYAVGEAASTGVQGANRLASNSVTEAIIAGRRTGAALAGALAGTCSTPVTASSGGRVGQDRGSKQGIGPDTRGKRPFHPASSAPFAARSDDRGSYTANSAAHDPRSLPEAGAGSSRAGGGERRLALARAMSRYAGVLRDGDGLAELLRVIAETGDPAGSKAQTAMMEAGESANEPGAAAETAAAGGPGEPGTGSAGTGGNDRRPALMLPGLPAGHGGPGNGRWGVKQATVREWGGLELGGVEAANLRTVSLLIAAGAARRAESRGCHRRRDAAGTAAAPWHTLARWDGRELVITEESL